MMEVETHTAEEVPPVRMPSILIVVLVLSTAGCFSSGSGNPAPQGLTIQPPEITAQFGVVPPAGFYFRDLNDRGLPEYVFEIDGSVMVLIPGDEEFQPFLIDKYEVTNGQYRHFCNQTARLLPRHPTNPAWKHYYLLPKPSHPIDHVAWYDAMDYATWTGKVLPSAAEWIRAATLGGEPDWVDGPPELAVANCADVGHRSPDRIGSFPADVSPSGVYDMAGNIDEWVADAGYGSNRRVMGGFWGTRREDLIQYVERGSTDDAQEPRHGFRTIFRLTPVE
jgi:hypothetical protein